MRSIALVSCVGKKLNQPAPAGEIYWSDWFKKAKGLAEGEGRFDCWYILSAKHHLLHPETVIEPYEMTLNTMTRCERLAWSTEVIKQLNGILCHGDLVTFFAGRRYREFIVPWLLKNNYNVSLPMVGMGIGQQLAWMKNVSPLVSVK